MTALQCQRCGFIANSEPRLVKHWKTELQCPALYSKVKHEDLIQQVRPKPTADQRTCQYCHKEFKSIGGMKNHSKKCKSNTASTSQSSSTDTNVVNVVVSPETKPRKTVNSFADVKRKKNLYSSVETASGLNGFDKEIDWQNLQISQTRIIELCRKKAEGIIDLFIEVHNNDAHDNIRWFYDPKHDQNKLIVYDGKTWVDVNHTLITKHLWFMYSFLEENWCDYLSAVRCNLISEDNVLSDEEQKQIDEFYYDNIVDDESVFFHCKEMFYDYMEAIKTI